MREEKKDKDTLTLESVDKKCNAVAAKLREISDNWKRFVKNHVDEDSNGKVGSAMLKGLIGISVIAFIAISAIATERIVDWTSGDGVNNGTAYIDSDQAGTATLTVDEIVADITGDQVLTGGATISGLVTNGTVLSSVKIVPSASDDTTGTLTRQIGLVVGEQSGTTAFGFGDTTNTSYGIHASFGRTAPASASWDGNRDSPLEVRMINKLTNNSAYNMAGGHIKCKNYSTGTVGDFRGLWIEPVDDGTVTDSSGLYISTDSSEIDNLIDMNGATTPATSDIRFSNGALIKNGSASLLTITEATVDIDGASTASSYASDAGITAVTEVTIDGKYAVVGPDASTGLMVQSGTFTFSGDGTVTQAFTASYSSAIPVVLEYSESPGSTTNSTWVTDNTGTNFIGHGIASKGAYWIAVGARP